MSLLRGKVSLTFWVKKVFRCFEEGNNMRKRDVFCFICAPLLVVLAIFIWEQIPFEDRDVISEHSYYVYVLLMKLLAGFLYLLAIIISLKNIIICCIIY